MRAPMAASPGFHDPMQQATRVAVVAALSATAMLFASLASAYLVRRSLPDWRPAAPGWSFLLLGLGLLASTGMEAAARSRERRRRLGLRLLGGSSLAYLITVFLIVAGTVTEPGGLAAPHQAFVALLLGLHGLHALVATLFAHFALGASHPEAAGPVLFLARLATHFLTALLVAILFLLFVLQ